MAETARRSAYTMYSANGSAAYDRNYALPKQPHPELPDEQTIRRQPRTVRVKAKAAFSPFVVVGLAMVAVMLFMMISAYVRLYEATEEVSALTSTLETLRDEQQVLLTQYESRIDLSRIEQMATLELNMTKPGADQTIYVNLAGPDKAEVITANKSEAAQTIWEAFSESINDLVTDLKAYFR